MMRSLYSGVAGLKTHQIKMDVIGNNIANVNTVGYKSSSVTFSELMYQTSQNASGANAATGRGGINPKQIGLGVKSGASTTSIEAEGASQNTGNPFDIQISGSSFFIVNNGSTNFFSRADSYLYFTVFPVYIRYFDAYNLSNPHCSAAHKLYHCSISFVLASRL